MLTPVENPTAYGLVETDARRQHPAVPREAEAGRDHDQPHQRRHLRARARHVRPDPERRALVDRAQLLPVAHRARRDLRRLRLRRLLDRHRHAGEVHAGAPRHHGRPLRRGAVPRTCRRRARRSPPDARIEDGATIEGPCFIDEGVLVKAGARIGPYSVIGRQTQIEEDAHVEGAIIWPNCRISRDAAVRNAIVGRNCHLGRNVTRRPRRGARRQDHAHRLHASLVSAARMPHCTLRPCRSTRHLQGLRHPRPLPGEINEDDRARRSAAASPRICKATTIGVSRDMRVSSPAHRRGVHRRRPRSRAPTSSTTACSAPTMMYFAVVNDGLDGGAQITASHNPGAVQRHQDGARRRAAAQRRRRHRRHPRHDRQRSPAAARGHARAARPPATSSPRYVEKVMSFIDPAVIKPFNVVLDAGSGMAGLVAPQLFDRLPCQTTKLCFDDRRHVPQPRSQSAASRRTAATSPRR